MESERKISGNIFFSLETFDLENHAPLCGKEKVKMQLEQVNASCCDGGGREIENIRKTVDWRRKAPHETFGQK